MRLKVLFICTHNSARSQMAEGLLNDMVGDRFEAYSAGTQPGTLNRFAVKAMAELGLDISQNRPKSIREFLGQDIKINIVVTVCDGAKEACPVLPGAKTVIHHTFTDPEEFSGTDEMILAQVRRVRDEIKNWLEHEFDHEIHKLSASASASAST